MKNKELFKKITDYIKINHLLSRNDRLIISFSGGPDSVFLLEFLKQYLHKPCEQLILVYFDHGLRPEETGQERAFVRNTGKNLKIKTITKLIPVKLYAEKYSCSIETAARNIRRSMLRHYSKIYGITYIVTGHNLDDVTETFFQRIYRGVKSNLGSIEPESPLCKNTLLIRPLLNIEKKEITTFLNKNKIAFMLDSSNTKNIYTRNIIRNQISPVIEGINPSYRNNVNSLLEYLKEQKNYISQATGLIIKDIKFASEQISFNLNKFKSYHIYVQKSIIFEMLNILKNKISQEMNSNRRIDLPDYIFSSATVNEILNRVSVNNMKTNVTLSKNYLCTTKKEEIIFKKKEVPAQDKPYIYTIKKIPAVIRINESSLTVKLSIITNSQDSFISDNRQAFLNYDLMKGHAITIRNRKEGDYFIPYGCDYKVKIKKYFINKKINIRLRNNLPLFFCQNHLAWVLGNQISDLFKINKGVKNILKIEIVDR
ncbi:MAG: tRNA lysidine(34) synthetase TilS [bacterium]|nr:tRNA lysidine(34) synthetase TilS [bacterium]